MALVPKVVSNTLNELIILEDVTGFAGGQVRIPALAHSVDLTTMATEDALAASYHLAHLANTGDITVNQAFTVGAPFPISSFAGEPYPDASAGYALLAHSTITNSGATLINGDVDLSPAGSITGFPPGTINGATNNGNATAASAMTSATAAFTAGQTAGSGGSDIPSALDGQTLVPGNYQFASGAATLAASAPGTLTLNGAGNYVIYTASTLGVGAGGQATVLLTNGATASNVLWVVGSSATLNGPNAFNGNLIADASVSFTGAAGGVYNGQFAALTGAITIANAQTVNAPSNFTGVTWA